MLSEDSDVTRQLSQRNGDIWERTVWLWSVLFYATLIVPTVIAMLDDEVSAEARTPILVLSLLFAGLHAGMILYTRRYPDFRSKRVPWVILMYAIAAVILWVILTILHPAFYLLLFSLYSQFYSLLHLVYAIPLSLLLTAMVGYTQIYDGNLIPNAISAGNINWSSVFVYLFMVIAGVMFSLWISAIIQQSAERRMLIAELQQTQQELADSEREAGRLAERQRLARDIHDTLAQGFSSIVMNMEAAEQALPDDVETVARHIDATRAIARTSLEQARRVVADLRPELLEQEPLPQAIERFVANWGAQTGIRASAVTTGEPVQLHPQIEVTLLRATQEALANIQKHAGAACANVTLSYLGDLVILDVQDDGVGMGNGVSAEALSSGFGLTAMRERVASLNGELQIESSAEDGTTISVQIPIGTS